MVFYATVMIFYALAAGFIVAIMSATAWHAVWTKCRWRYSNFAYTMLQHTGKVANTSFILTAIVIYIWAFS